MDFFRKRIVLFCGHYGSGKTNIAVNAALAMRRTYEKVLCADLDIVNPYFRTTDSRAELENAGIRVVSSPYAGTNLDAPAMPQEIYGITDDRSFRCVIDVGGDDRGAYALGRLAPAILAENDYEMLFVVNRCRPLTPDAASAEEVRREIEAACGIPFTGIVNNTNLGEETTADLVLRSAEYAAEVSALCGLPLRFTAVNEALMPELEGRPDSLFPLHLQKKPI